MGNGLWKKSGSRTAIRRQMGGYGSGAASPPDRCSSSFVAEWGAACGTNRAAGPPFGDKWGLRLGFGGDGRAGDRREAGHRLEVAELHVVADVAAPGVVGRAVVPRRLGTRRKGRGDDGAAALAGADREVELGEVPAG